MPPDPRHPSSCLGHRKASRLRGLGLPHVGTEKQRRGAHTSTATRRKSVPAAAMEGNSRSANARPRLKMSSRKACAPRPPARAGTAVARSFAGGQPSNGKPKRLDTLVHLSASSDTSAHWGVTCVLGLRTQVQSLNLTLKLRRLVKMQLVGGHRGGYWQIAASTSRRFPQARV